MKIALFGYGKMGKEIEKIALQRGHQIIFKIESEIPYNLTSVDVAIDFSIPDVALNNIVDCFKNDTPVVSGTTGWLENYDEAIKSCEKNNGSFIYASNFSIGVNIFFELNNHLAKMMNPLNEYSTHIEEIHHTKKLDAPSGTAITLAEGIMKNSSMNEWELIEKSAKTTSKTIPISSKRLPDIFGTHIVSYQSDIDSIEITHTANNRKGFALGAVIAAEWLLNKKGVYSMKDVLNIG